MQRNLFASGLALLMVATLPLASAYHIDGTNTNVPADPLPGITPPPPGTLSTSDWRFDTGSAVIICESEGPLDDLNSNPKSPGIGGLCYTGRNDATGTNAPGATAALSAGCQTVVGPGVVKLNDPTCPPAINLYTILDTCAFTIQERNGDNGFNGTAGVGGFGPFGPFQGTVANLCVYNNTQWTNVTPISTTPRGDHSWFVSLGTISCLVNTVNPEAVYYSERYAWWTYELGTPPYSSGDAAGQAHQGKGTNLLPPPLNTLGRRDAYHGHVAMFLDPPVFWPNTTASLDGSAETVSITAPVPVGAGIAYAPCGSSPGPDATGDVYSPIFKGPQVGP